MPKTSSVFGHGFSGVAPWLKEPALRCFVRVSDDKGHGDRPTHKGQTHHVGSLALRNRLRPLLPGGVPKLGISPLELATVSLWSAQLHFGFREPRQGSVLRLWPEAWEAEKPHHPGLVVKAMEGMGASWTMANLMAPRPKCLPTSLVSSFDVVTCCSTREDSKVGPEFARGPEKFLLRQNHKGLKAIKRKTCYFEQFWFWDWS